MKETTKFDDFSGDKAISLAKTFAKDAYTKELGVVLSVAFSDIRNLPALGFNQDEPIPLKEYVKKWVSRYFSGYNGRPSKRHGKKSQTKPDPAVKLILRTRREDIDDNFADTLEKGHSLMMTIEGMVGNLLEEYLATILHPYGWYCCWGSTIDAVDFCKEDGSLLQVKTSNNSENSSSIRVRNGTEIRIWFRRFFNKANTFNWVALNEISAGTYSTKKILNENSGISLPGRSGRIPAASTSLKSAISKPFRWNCGNPQKQSNLSFRIGSIVIITTIALPAF